MLLPWCLMNADPPHLDCLLANSNHCCRQADPAEYDDVFIMATALVILRGFLFDVFLMFGTADWLTEWWKQKETQKERPPLPNKKGSRLVRFRWPPSPLPHSDVASCLPVFHVQQH